MTDMTPESLRDLVAQHLGTERFRRFVRTFNFSSRRKGRLAFWQQDVIAELATTHPRIADMTIDDLTPAFRLCHVHLSPLVDFDVPIEPGVTDVYLAPEYERAMIDHFPYSPTFALAGPDSVGQSHVTCDQCPECVLAMEAYNAGQRDA